MKRGHDARSGPAPGGERGQTLTAEAWLAALMDPVTSFDFSTYGYGRLPATWGYEGRRVPEHLVYSVVSEELWAALPTGTYRLPPGGFCLLPPHTRHSFTHMDAARPVMLQWFRLALRRDATALALDRGPIVLSAAPALRGHFEQLHDQLQSGTAPPGLRTKAILTLLFSRAFELADASSAAGPTLSYNQRQQLYELVRARIAERLRPADLAAAVHLSADHFARLFRRTFGVSPRRWLVQQRVQQATADLVESTMNMSEIAEALGYPDVFQFSRQFKQVMGVSPRAYRQRYRAVRMEA